jgi:hypothetical protein
MKRRPGKTLDHLAQEYGIKRLLSRKSFNELLIPTYLLITYEAIGGITRDSSKRFFVRKA